MDTPTSILDRVITSRQHTEIEQFNPMDVVTTLFKSLSNREDDVLRRRYGLHGKERETLEHIGETYGVTRERIRQIEHTAVGKIKKNKAFTVTVAALERTVSTVLEQHGGIMTEGALLEELLQLSGDTATARRHILFVIGELLPERFRRLPETDALKEAWQLAHASLHLLRGTIDETVAIVTRYAKPMPLKNLLAEFKQTPFYQQNTFSLTDDAVVSYITVSQRISSNPYQEYGLREWGTIVPKRMNDKIYLVLKNHGKPMHFNDITRAINDMKFDQRRAYPPTVHNELILNDRYVLVGRGIYALKEWGYQPGVVANVLRSLLEQAPEPMTREALVAKVLEQRIVKKNTIHLALTDKTKFTKLPDGRYTLTRVA